MLKKRNGVQLHNLLNCQGIVHFSPQCDTAKSDWWGGGGARTVDRNDFRSLTAWEENVTERKSN